MRSNNHANVKQWLTLNRATHHICFDEAFNQISEKGQMDIEIRFWDSSMNNLCSLYVLDICPRCLWVIQLQKTWTTFWKHRVRWNYVISYKSRWIAKCKLVLSRAAMIWFTWWVWHHNAFSGFLWFTCY